MPFPVSLLPDRATCDLVLPELTQELRVFKNQAETLDLRADQGQARVAERAAARQATVESIARLTPQVAGYAAGTPEFLVFNRLLTRAKRRLEDFDTPAATLTDTPLTPAQKAAAAFLQAVDVAQAAAQVPVLEQAIAEVTAHRATLPA